MYGIASQMFSDLAAPLHLLDENDEHKFIALLLIVNRRPIKKSTTRMERYEIHKARVDGLIRRDVQNDVS